VQHCAFAAGDVLAASRDRRHRPLHPAVQLSNAELVEAFNAYVERFNAANADAIAAGETVA